MAQHDTRRSIQCCLSDLPDETMISILKYCYTTSDPTYPARWLARFGTLSSKFSKLVVSNAMNSVWSQIPVCLCDEVHCEYCGREKIPMSYYRKVLNNCCLEKLDVHFFSAGTIFSPGSDGSLIASELERISHSTLAELTMHTTMAPSVYETECHSNSSQDFSREHRYRYDDNDGLNNLNRVSSFTLLRTMFVTTQFLSQDVTWQQYRASDLACKSAIKFFGETLLELSLHSMTIVSLDVSDEIVSSHHICLSNQPLQELCPHLETLELNGHLPSVLLKDGRYLTTTSLTTLRVNNPYFWEWNGTIDHEEVVVPYQLPNLITFTADSTYEHSDQIVLEILPLCPPSVTNLRLMGNTIQYLNDVLCHISIMAPRNLMNLISLEIYDCYFPSLTEDDVLENYAVNDITLACPQLARLVLPIVRLPALTLSSLTLSFGNFVSDEVLIFQRSYK